MDDKKNREDWLDAGLRALAEDGPDGLRIMPIARQLGVTKGSFYWHFQGTEDYLQALIVHWEQRHTQAAIACVESMGGDAQTRLRHWFMGAAGSDLALSRAIRSWSLANHGAREVQARVDQQRIDYLVALLRATGWTKGEALTLGRWSYWAYVGYSTLEGPQMIEKEVNLILSILAPR